MTDLDRYAQINVILKYIRTVCGFLKILIR